MQVIYSDLHQNIQESFNKGGVEICSPHFSALRDGNTITIPEQFRPQDYRAPAFRVESDPKRRRNKPHTRRIINWASHTRSIASPRKCFGNSLRI